MLRPISKFTVTQIPNKDFPNRTKRYVFSFYHEFDGGSTWEDLADTGKLILPTLVPLLDSQTNQKIYLSGQTLIENNNPNPIFLKGDKIKVELGYIYLTTDGEKLKSDVFFIGYITDIKVKMSIEFTLMDEMYQMQQTPAKGKTYKQITLKDLLLDQIGNKYQIDKAAAGVNLGDFVVDNSNGEITIAELLNYLRDQYKIETFFRFQPDESFILFCSGLVYYPQFRKDSNNNFKAYNFSFQQNIISDDLEWFSTKDVKIKVVAKSIIKQKTGKFNANGSQQTKQTEISATVGSPNGETRTIYLDGVKTVAELKTRAQYELNKMYYEGFRGSFTTFGLPLIKSGYAVNIQDPALPERNGIYLVKSVRYPCGIGGNRQIITLAIKIQDGDSGNY